MRPPASSFALVANFCEGVRMRPRFAFAKCGLIRGGAIFTRILSDMKLFCPNLLNKIQVMV